MKRINPSKVDYAQGKQDTSQQDSLIFPTQIINGVAGQFAWLYSEYLEVPVHFFYMAFLTCLGTTLSNRLTLASEIAPQPRLYVFLLGGVF